MILPDVLGCPRCGHSVRKTAGNSPGCGWRLTVVRFATDGREHERLIVTSPEDPAPPPVVNHPDPFDKSGR